jgi:hypothetical protein
MSHHLPYSLPTIGIIMCVMFCVSRINFQLSSKRPYGPSPREAFLGRKADYSRDFRCGFGDFVQATVATTDNSMNARTDGCIVMLPTGNRTGSVKLLSLSTGKIITRDSFKILPIPASAIARMNELSGSDGRNTAPHSDTTILRTAPVEAVDTANEPTRIVITPHEGDDPTDLSSLPTDILSTAQQYDNLTDPIQPRTYHSDIQSDISAAAQTADDIEGGEGPTMKDKRNLIDFFRHGTADMVMNISVRDALRTRGDSAKEVIMTELKQMIARRVWTPVNASSLTPTERSNIIRSSMFLREKYLPTGAFDKLKARLVAGGNQQDRQFYDDLSAL